LSQATAQRIQEMGYRVNINRPYAGTMVPMAFYQKDRRVASIMIEVNRNLYMDELAGTKSCGFDTVKAQIQTLLDAIRAFQP
jgi:N-formylglutamate amidohydrolase